MGRRFLEADSQHRPQHETLLLGQPLPKSSDKFTSAPQRKVNREAQHVGSSLYSRELTRDRSALLSTQQPR